MLSEETFCTLAGELTVLGCGFESCHGVVIDWWLVGVAKTDAKSFVHPVLANVKDNSKCFGMALHIVLELIQGLTESNGSAVIGCGH